MTTKISIIAAVMIAGMGGLCVGGVETNGGTRGAEMNEGMQGGETNEVTDLGMVVVEASALSKYRPATVGGGTFTDEAPEKLPVTVDTITEDFIREHNPTDLHDLLRYVPGIETGGKSLLIRQPGTFTIRGMGGSEPTFDGVVPVGRGAGLFMDPFLMERIEVVKGPVGSLSGGAGAQQNNSGAGGSVNMHLKGATLDGTKRQLQANTSAGRNTWRQRGMIDANQVSEEGDVAVRGVGAFDVYAPAYTAHGAAKGADPRQSYTLAPSAVWKTSERVTMGFKTLFQATDQPSYIGVPVWRGKPAGGYGWQESSCREGDRSRYESLYINPYVDVEVTEEWKVKLGGAFMLTDWEQRTREPYMNNRELAEFYRTGRWTSGQKYMTSGFSESQCVARNYNLYARTVWTKEELPWGFRNVFMAQPDFYYRESTTGFGTPVSRWGVTVQDSVGWGWVTVLGGVRADAFQENAHTEKATANGVTTRTHYRHCHAEAVSPRGGLTVQPLDWLVLFGNLSQTRTPTLGYRDADGGRPTDPWTATQVEGGVRVRPAEKLWLSASVYRLAQENTPVAATVDNDTYYYFEGENRSHGAEVSLTGDVTKNWTVMALYANNRYEDCTAAQNRVFRRNPNHTFSLSTSYKFDGNTFLDGVVVGAGYRFRSKSFATLRGTYVDDNLYFNPSHVFDVNASVPLSKFGGSADWILTFGVRNLFGEKYFESSRHFYECLAGEPRTFEIGVRATF